jgi:hypothetical protein
MVAPQAAAQGSRINFVDRDLHRGDMKSVAQILKWQSTWVTCLSATAYVALTERQQMQSKMRSLHTRRNVATLIAFSATTLAGLSVGVAEHAIARKHVKRVEIHPRTRRAAGVFTSC